MGSVGDLSRGGKLDLCFRRPLIAEQGKDRRGQDWRPAYAAVLAAAVSGQWGVFFETRNAGGEAIGPRVDELPPGSV